MGNNKKLNGAHRLIVVFCVMLFLAMLFHTDAKAYWAPSDKMMTLLASMDIETQINKSSDLSPNLAGRGYSESRKNSYIKELRELEGRTERTYPDATSKKDNFDTDTPKSGFENDIVELEHLVNEHESIWKDKTYILWVNKKKYVDVTIHSITDTLLVVILVRDSGFIVVPLNGQNKVILTENN